MASATPHLRRLPRSIEESSSYYPDWRWRQTEQYLNLNLLYDARGEHFSVPEWEDDEEVRKYFTYRRHATGFNKEDTRRFFYTDDTVEHNSRTGAAARIRCLLIAGATPEYVAKRMGTKVEYIETFYRLFFDAAPYFDNKDFVSSLVFPFVIPRNEPPENKKERLWRTGAFLMEIPGFDAISQKKIDMNSADLEKMNGQLRSLMYSQGLEFCLHRRAGMLPGPGDLDNVLAHMQIPTTGDSERDSQSSIFTTSLIKVAAEKYNLVATKTREVEVISVTRIKEPTSYEVRDIDITYDNFAGEWESNPLELLN